MARAKDFILRFVADTSKFDEAIEASEAALDDLGATGTKIIEGLDDLTGGLASSFLKNVKGLKTFVQGMGALKGAIVSTGIGALVVALGSLVAYFAETRKGQEMLRVATEALTAVWDNLVKTAASLGETIISAFQNPRQAITDFANTIKHHVQDRIASIMGGIGLLGDAISKLFEGDFSGAMEAGAEAVKKIYYENSLLAKGVEGTVEAVSNLTTQIVEAAKEGAHYAEQQIALESALRKRSLMEAQYARELAEVEGELGMVNLSTERQIELINQREAIENARINTTEKLLRQELAIMEQLKRRRDLEDEELEHYYELLAEIETLEAERTTLTASAEAERQQLRMDAADQYLEKQEEIDSVLAAMESDEKQREIDAVIAEYEELFALAQKYGMDEQGLVRMQKEAIEAIEDEFRQRKKDKDDEAAREEFERRQAAIQGAFELTQMGLDALSALNDIYEGEDVNRQRKAFNRNKAIQKANTILATAMGIQQALASPKDVLTGQNFVKAGLIAASGIVQLAKIGSTKFDGGGSSGGFGAPSEPSAPQLDLSFMNQGAPQQSGLRAYVLEQNVTSQQMLNQSLKEQSKL